MMEKSFSLSAAESEAVGSSMTISRAFRMRARQMLISQFSAVERPLTPAKSGALRPTRRATGATSLAIAVQSIMPKRLFFGSPNMMFSMTFMLGTKASSWWMKLMPSSAARCGVGTTTGAPSRRMRPPSGWVTPARMRIRVDLPAPFAPTRPCTSPGRRSRDTPLSAWTPP